MARKIEPEYIEKPKAKERFERAMTVLFNAPKPPKHEPKKRKKRGKD
jgi:hypothetical protein